MRVDQISTPVMYLPADPSADGTYALSVADFFRRDINGHQGIHARMVVLARIENGIWRTDTEYGGDSITRPFSLDPHGLKWFAALLAALGEQGEIDDADDVALTMALCGRPFVGSVKVSAPKSVRGTAKRFVNVTRFAPCPPEAERAIFLAGVLEAPPVNGRVEAP